MAWTRPREEVLDALNQQREALIASCKSYDEGNRWEALRLATAVYIIVHDGGRNSKSILTQLGLRGSLRFVGSGIPCIPGKGRVHGATVRGRRHMNGWNRLFVVIAVCWAIVAPFLLMEDANRPVHQIFDSCGSAAYHRYGASDSTIRLDWAKYEEEAAKCLAAFSRDFVSLPKLLSALIGM
jgi:hypothetical protein